MAKGKQSTATAQPTQGRPVGRPRKEIDLKVLENLCRINCTKEEIASVLEVSSDTIERYILEKFKVNFAVFFKRFQGSGKISLRRMQWASARKGNVTMQIWLGKQYLGQADKVEAIGPPDTPPLRVVFADVPPVMIDPKVQDNLEITE